MDADIRALRDQFLDKSFDEKSFNIDPAVTSGYAKLSGELTTSISTQSILISKRHPCRLFSGRRSMPEDFPRFGFVDAGKGIECFARSDQGRPLVYSPPRHLYKDWPFRPNGVRCDAYRIL